MATIDEPGQTAYDLLGGDAALRALVDRFYQLMDTEPGYAVIRKLHPASLAGSNDKLYRFLSGWMGGPSLYVEKYGAPMLRARHLPYPIGSPERDQWLSCMDRAMAECALPPELAEALRDAFFRTADWMRNKPGDLPDMPR